MKFLLVPLIVVSLLQLSLGYVNAFPNGQVPSRSSAPNARWNSYKVMMGEYESSPMFTYGSGIVEVRPSYISQTYKRVSTCVDIRPEGMSGTYSCGGSFSGSSKPSECPNSAFSSNDFEDSSQGKYKLCFDESAFTEYSIYELDESQSDHIQVDVRTFAGNQDPSELWESETATPIVNFRSSYIVVTRGGVIGAVDKECFSNDFQNNGACYAHSRDYFKTTSPRVSTKGNCKDTNFNLSINYLPSLNINASYHFTTRTGSDIQHDSSCSRYYAPSSGLTYYGICVEGSIENKYSPQETLYKQESIKIYSPIYNVEGLLTTPGDVTVVQTPQSCSQKDLSCVRTSDKKIKISVKTGGGCSPSLFTNDDILRMTAESTTSEYSLYSMSVNDPGLYASPIFIVSTMNNFLMCQVTTEMSVRDEVLAHYIVSSDIPTSSSTFGSTMDHANISLYFIIITFVIMAFFGPL